MYGADLGHIYWLINKIITYLGWVEQKGPPTPVLVFPL